MRISTILSTFSRDVLLESLNIWLFQSSSGKVLLTKSLILGITIEVNSKIMISWDINYVAGLYSTAGFYFKRVKSTGKFGLFDVINEVLRKMKHCMRFN